MWSYQFKYDVTDTIIKQLIIVKKVGFNFDKCSGNLPFNLLTAP